MTTVRPRPWTLPRLTVLLVAAAGCSSYPPPPRPAPPPPPAETWPRAVGGATRIEPRPAEPVARQPADPAAAAGRRAVELARSLLRAPYRFGGEDRRGFDCSGLVTWVFERLGVELPRTAEDQSGAGRWVAPDELRPGDLVFFGDRRDKLHHVGLVVSAAGEPLTMIHASKSRGVVETEVFRDAYWLDRFRFGRRVLAAD